MIGVIALVKSPMMTSGVTARLITFGRVLLSLAAAATARLSPAGSFWSRWLSWLIASVALALWTTRSGSCTSRK